MGILGSLKKMLGEDLSGLNENDCFIKAQEGNWDNQTGTYRNPTKALKYLDRAIQLNHRKADAYTGRGQAYQQLNKFDLALMNFNTAIKIEPTDINYFMRGMCYLKAGQVKNALEDLSSAIKLNPTNISYYGVRAGVYAVLQRFDLAILDYDKIIEIEPDNFEHYVCRGYQYYELGEFQKAIDDYDIAIDLEPNVIQIHEYRHLAQEKLHN